jgi:predicted dinucleotide-binding enzyme
MDGTLPTIAVIGGTGAEGSAIALRLANAGYRVIIGTRDSLKGAQVVAELDEILGAKALEFAHNIDAAQTAAIVILTVPYNAQMAMIEELRSAPENKILIDATVPLTPPKVGNVQLPRPAVRPLPQFRPCSATK